MPTIALATVRGIALGLPNARERTTCLRPAAHWGRDGWVAVPLDEVTDQELPDLLTDGHDLAVGATR